MEQPLDGPTKQALEASYAASKTLIYVIDDLLHLTGNATGSAPQLSDPFDLRLCLHETLEPLGKAASAKGIGFDYRQDPGVSHFVMGDLQSFSRAISVLVANAVENTSHGQVTVEWTQPWREGEQCIVKIAVLDDGEGLSEEELDDLFQDLEQIPDEDADEPPLLSSRQNRAVRIGVGLSFVARHIKNRNGQLIVSSTKGQGSRFVVELPFLIAETPLNVRRGETLPKLSMPRRNIIQMATSSGQPGAELLISQSTPSKENSSTPIVESLPWSVVTSSNPTSRPLLFVLIADDNIINARILEKRLGKMGHDVKVSRDGMECFDLFVEHQAKVDFVLMDLDVSLATWEKQGRSMLIPTDTPTDAHCQRLRGHPHDPQPREATPTAITSRAVARTSSYICCFR